MTYNFDEVIERRGTDSVKWDGVKSVWGRDDLLPMWVADMDFRTPPFVMEALRKRERRTGHHPPEIHERSRPRRKHDCPQHGSQQNGKNQLLHDSKPATTNDNVNSRLNNNWSFAVISSRPAMALSPFPGKRDTTRTLPMAGTSAGITSKVHKGRVPTAIKPAIQPKGKRTSAQ